MRAPLASAMVTSTGFARPSSCDVEAGQDVVDARQRKQPLHLRRRNLLHVDAAAAVERGDPAILLQPVGVGGHLDEADTA